MDRFSQGLPDPQEQPLQYIPCAYDDCDNEIPVGMDAWDYEGQCYCSVRCLLEYLGAERREAE